jgi:hypothetical protein
LRLDQNSKNTKEGSPLVKITDIENANISDGDMVGALMLDGVGGEVDRAGVLILDQGDSRQRMV